MRSPLVLVLALSLLVSSVWQGQSQTLPAAPRGAEAIPGYPGLYVADADRFMAGAFVITLLTRPGDVRTFLSRVKTCASQRALANRLRQEGLTTFAIAFAEVLPALRTGACDVFVGVDFDFEHLDRRLDPGPDGQVPDRPQPDGVVPGRDPEGDRTPPEIAPLQQVFQGPGRTVRVEARITDRQSGIRSAFVVMPGGGRQRMSAPGGSSVYSAQVNLPRDFDDQTVAIQATDSAGRSARQVVTLRRLPWCGPREVIDGALVREIQESLACVGLSPGRADGVLGPDTCNAIGAFLGRRMDVFNAGRLRWSALRDEVGRACREAQPVTLDMPGPIEADEPRIVARIGLSQAGATETIRVTGPGIGAQMREWHGQALAFGLPMPPPGQDSAYQVQALGPDGTPLDSEILRLIRPAALLAVRPSGQVVVDDPHADFTVAMSRGAAAVARIEAHRPGAPAIGKAFTGGPMTLSVPSPVPGASSRVDFVALDGDARPVARQIVTLSRAAPVLSPVLSLDSPAGRVVDAAVVHLRLGLENPGAAQDLVVSGGPAMAELARRPADPGIWDIWLDMPPPGQPIVFVARAVDRTGRELAADRLRITRAPIRLQVTPTGRVEADTDRVTVQVHVMSGADWVTAIVARADGTGPVLQDGAPVQGRAQLQLGMPAPGNALSVEVSAIGRDGRPYAPARLILVRPAAQQHPVALHVTSPDGFAVDAKSIRLSVQVRNPADTAVIVVADPASGDVLARSRFDGGDWRGQVAMPAPGKTRALIVEARDAAGNRLAGSRIMLLRPLATGPVIPPTVWIGGLVLLGVMVGYLAARLRGRGADPDADLKKPPPRPNIYTEPDHDPTVGMVPPSPPVIVVRVEEDAKPDIEIKMEQDKGA